MPTYLKKEEYEKMGFADISGPFSFENLLMRASLILDNKTRHFYNFTDFKDDYQWRVDKFKKAIGAQIEYFVQNESLTTSQLQNKPTSISIGRTSISSASKGRNTSSEELGIVCPEIYMILEGTGLLYRGVR